MDGNWLSVLFDLQLQFFKKLTFIQIILLKKFNNCLQAEIRYYTF